MRSNGPESLIALSLKHKKENGERPTIPANAKGDDLKNARNTQKTWDAALCARKPLLRTLVTNGRCRIDDEGFVVFA